MPGMIVLAHPKSANPYQILEDLSSPWSDLVADVEAVDGKQFLGADWYVTVSKVKDRTEFIEDYDDESIDPTFRNVVEMKDFLTVYFNDLGRLKAFLLSLLEHSSVDAHDWWVDTDYGTILRGDGVVSSIRGDPDWDWRT